MKTIKKAKEMSAFSNRAKARGQTLALVPTMGALHEGHLSLVESAKEKANIVIVSIFINPTQFAPTEDLKKYPKNLLKDQKALKLFDPIIIFAPSEKDLYSSGFDTWVEEGTLSRRLCGKFRFGHFKGVTTIVTKLFNIVRPDYAIFGEKDYQQQLIIKKITRDLNYPIEIATCPTVREYDGLAMSSRNQYLSEKERKSATVLYKALIRAKKDIEGGETDCRKIIVGLGRLIGFEAIVRVDYINIVNPETLEEVKEIGKEKVLIAIAGRIGKTRLIDSMIVTPK
ncbi:pantoate--beta-alanine ligase [candidate division WOR-1 bacterium RIFOXYA2_FULL_36_21]|uniref:Pantothenate synthetase n=1 Tax=candidate division WOR-1 bacterium RIFOXYB2_FULL_36_35 TaxID=1802578 RepID=A0A1F4S2S6_UNCSA|nr:MAG: pantoate--beta-alanine ligase [candidate division WOR-1 bacterium RIFOXYA2_FULL_36_21]OGC14679.1 MAG: pantoate--beta-alanine ligase [candidate division WOR-1 bacterium RIFOXYB2_FULL_36_35]OGC19697.1 MAG: pantoate--beta-alanine ligase [candidate division WOR-1 bacterium RIFOXYA12_FULL_36_13]